MLLGRMELLFYRSRATLYATISAAYTEGFTQPRRSFGSTGARDGCRADAHNAGCCSLCQQGVLQRPLRVTVSSKN